MNRETTTIAALATAPAPAGVAVVRVSGPNARTAVRAIFRSRKDPIDDPRRLTFGDLIDYRSHEQIDRAMAVFMPGPHSYTGEDVAEFQFHGSPVLVQRVLRSLFAFGAIPAEPGEFTKRAFLNGKIDLAQAEAVGDLVNATDEQALKLASEQLHGRLSRAVGAIGDPLRDVLAEIEASVDFPDEGIAPKRLGELGETLAGLSSQISGLIHSYDRGHLIREGFKVLLCGKPNVGKSSILNLLLGKDRAIVSDVAGTTRDLIEEEAVFSGYRFIFCDSAGLTETEDTVEKIGIGLTRKRIEWADLVLCVVDASEKDSDWQQILHELRGKAKKIWMVTNKIDLNPAGFSSFFCERETCEQNFYLSAKTHDGLGQLTQALVDEVQSTKTNFAEGSGVAVNERHRACLLEAEYSLKLAIENIQGRQPAEIVSADLRSVLKALDEIVGKTYTEDILGRIFSKFCIGK